MNESTKKPGRTARILGAVFPFKKPAQQALQPAADGLELTRDLLARIKADINPTPRHAAPQTFAEAQALWREAAMRHGLDAQAIAIRQRALDNSWLALFLAGTVAAALGIAGVILIFIDPGVQAVGLAASVCPAGVAATLLLRVNVRRSQVRARALVSWPQFRKAADGIAPAIFGDVKLTAAAVDGGQ